MATTPPNVEPIFLRTPFIKQASLTNQVAVRSPITTPVTLLKAGEAGAIIQDLWIAPGGTISANILFFYLQTATGWDFFWETQIAAATATTGTAIAPQKLAMPTVLAPATTDATKKQAIVLSPELVIGVALETASAVPVIVVAAGGDY
jgi:hypothetical protein